MKERLFNDVRTILCLVFSQAFLLASYFNDAGGLVLISIMWVIVYFVGLIERKVYLKQHREVE